MITAKNLLKMIGEVGDASIYDASIKVANFDANKLPEIKNAIIAKLGGQVEVKFDTASSTFYVDGAPEVVDQVKAILKEEGVELVGDAPAAAEPSADIEIPVSASASAESMDDEEEPEVEGEEESDTDLDHDGMDGDDDEILQNGRLNDIFQRIQTKIERMPAIKRGYYYRILVKDMMRAVEGKSGAPMAMLAAAKDFLKTQF